MCINCSFIHFINIIGARYYLHIRNVDIMSLKLLLLLPTELDIIYFSLSCAVDYNNDTGLFHFATMILVVALAVTKEHSSSHWALSMFLLWHRSTDILVILPLTCYPSFCH